MEGGGGNCETWFIKIKSKVNRQTTNISSIRQAKLTLFYRKPKKHPPTRQRSVEISHVIYCHVGDCSRCDTRYADGWMINCYVITEIRRHTVWITISQGTSDGDFWQVLDYKQMLSLDMSSSWTLESRRMSFGDESISCTTIDRGSICGGSLLVFPPSTHLDTSVEELNFAQCASVGIWVTRPCRLSQNCRWWWRRLGCSDVWRRIWTMW